MDPLFEILGLGIDPRVIVFGFGIGVLVGMTGMGGASLMTPLLILVFGISPVTAIGTDIFYAAVTKTVGGYKHLKLGTVHRGIVFWMAAGSVPAAIGGVFVIEWLQRNYGDDLDAIVLGMLGGALLVVGVATLLRSLFLAGVIQERSALHLYRPHIIAAVITGVITGFVIGLTSAGSGTLIAIALIVIFRLTPQRVVGTDVFHAAILLWAAGAAHWIGGNIDFLLAGLILVGSIPGVIIGTNLSVKAPQTFLRYALAVVLIAIALIVIFRLTPQRVVGTDVFHAAILLWAAGAAHWIGGNIDFLLAGLILVGSIPGVIIGTNLSVKAPQTFLRYALAVVLIASGAMLVAKEGSVDVVVPAIGVASVMIGALFAGQALSRSRSKDRGKSPAQASAT